MKTYIITDGTYVKIGKSHDPYQRLSALQTAYPRQLALLLIIDGDCERSLHRQFASDRCEGEWFVLSPAIQSFINDEGSGIQTTGTLRCIGLVNNQRCTRRNLSNTYCLTCPVGPWLLLSDESERLLAGQKWETYTEASALLECRRR